VGAELAVIEADANEQAGAAPAAVTKVPVVAPARRPEHRDGGRPLAAPAVRARARELAIDLATITGSGPDSRITHADLDRLLTARAAHPAPFPVSAAPAESGSEDVPVFGLRRRIAERMQESTRRIPHFTYVEEIDVTRLEALRQTLNGKAADRPHLTLLPFLIRAIAMARAGHPTVNSHFDDVQGMVRRFAAVHAGIATQTERGLLVPVIRNADQLDVWQLAQEILRLSAAARSGKSARGELSGSTITVTSLGRLGGVMATPIINLPEVAIIGVNRIVERPAFADGAITARKLMNLSSSFDHRIIDGQEAAAFIADVRLLLEEPETLVATSPPKAEG
jgi:2-oxoisovalerate dehydrogenase E2 component (dihydrolipoyl transacylase)